jgi:hypothetical protein
MVKKMNKKFRAVKASFIMAILLFSVIVAISPLTTVSARDSRPKIYSFNSYIDIEYDPTPLNQNLVIDESINVPLTIRYWTDVPEGFMQYFPWQLRNIFLFGSPIGPMAQIHVEIVDRPEWANIYISQPDILTDIPFKPEEKKVNTSLILSPRIEAPAVSYTITLNVECQTIHRINGITYQESLDFTPSFVPTIDITPEDPTRTVGPRESVDFKITVKNMGNKLTKVTPELVNPDAKWVPTINPPVQEIQPQEEEVFTFSIYTPYDFGWHNEIQSFQIEFTTEVFPYRPDSPSDTRSIYLRVNNYGFSTPGFEVLTLLAALMIVALIIKKRYAKSN